MTKGKKKVYIIVALVAALALAGTLAYFFKTMSIDNPLETKKYGGSTVEKFTPEKDWQPGEKVDKEVKVQNTGDYDLIARVRFEEKWERLDADGKVIGTPYETNKSSNGLDNFNPAVDAAANVIAPNTVSDVHKNLINLGTSGKTWKFNATDGNFYWMEVIPSGGTTLPILKDLTLCNNTNMGTYDEVYEYALVDKTASEPAANSSEWTKVPDTGLPTPTADQTLYQRKIEKLSVDDPGHAGSRYTLTVITDVCQASTAAATENNWAETIPNLQ